LDTRKHIAIAQELPLPQAAKQSNINRLWVVTGGIRGFAGFEGFVGLVLAESAGFWVATGPLMCACRRHGKVLEELHTMHALFMLTSEFALQSKKCCKDTCAMPGKSSWPPNGKQARRMWSATKTRAGSVNEKTGLRSTQRSRPKRKSAKYSR